MKDKIIIYMVVRNVSKKQRLFEKVIEKASKVSKNFFIVNHGSSDNSTELIKDFTKKYNLNLELINENFEGTMDDMKGKYYKILREKYGKTGKYTFILDWDEVLDDELIKEINNLGFKYDVYLLNINTYLIKKVIDKNHFQPRLFKINSVKIGALEKFHKLYEIKSKNIKKLKGVIHHYSYENIEDLFSKNKYYAKGEAQDLFSKKNNISGFLIFIRFIFEGTIYFLYTLLYHLNFLHLEGWLYSVNWYVYKFYKYLFYLELKEKNENNRAN